MKQLIQQYITTGVRISKHQFSKLSNSQAKSYLRLRVRAKELSDYEVVKLNEVDKSAIESLIEDKYFTTYSGARQGHLLSSEQHLRVVKVKIKDNHPLTYNELFNYYDESQVETYLSTLNLSGAIFLLDEKPRDNDKLIKMLLINEKFSNKLRSSVIYDFVEYAENKELVINLLLNDTKLVPNIQGELLGRIIDNISDKESFINKLLNNNLFMDNLKPRTVQVLRRYIDKEPKEILSMLGDKINVGIYYYVEKSNKPREVFDMVGSENVKKFISYLLAKDEFGVSDSRLSTILQFARKEDELIKVLFTYSEFTDNLKSNHLNDILFRFEHNEDILIGVYKILLNNEQIMSNLTPAVARMFVRRSNEDTNEMLRVALKKYGHDEALNNMQG